MHLVIRGDTIYFGFISDDLGSSDAIADNEWYFVAWSYNLPANYKYIYLDGKLDNSGASSSSFQAENGISCIGSETTCGGGWFNGSIANVQVYNISLTANQIQYLYQEGIGGAPVQLQNLVGWWPLNGDTNDYSGNNNNGVPTNITYSGTWTSGYTPT